VIIAERLHGQSNHLSDFAIELVKAIGMGLIIQKPLREEENGKMLIGKKLIIGQKKFDQKEEEYIKKIMRIISEIMVKNTDLNIKNGFQNTGNNIELKRLSVIMPKRHSF
jgi:hypothetical protein